MIELRGVSKTYHPGPAEVVALRDVSLTIQQGEMVAIEGPSGSGKSSLMHILGGLDQAFQGEVRLAGRSIRQADDSELARLRRETIGFVFQRYHLIDDLQALENVALPLIYAGVEQGMAYGRASSLLADMGLQDQQSAWPRQLSGGQQQRVAVARALANQAPVILADEPTGALDSHNSEALMDLLCELHSQGHTVIVITHSAHVAARAQRRIGLRDGRVVYDRNTSVAGELRQVTIQDDRRGQSLSLPRSTRWREGLWHARNMTFRAALNALHRNPLRSMLGILGIVVGIASLISTLAVAEGTRQEFMRRLTEDNRILEIRALPLLSAKGELISGHGHFAPWVVPALRQTGWFEQVTGANANVHSFVHGAKTVSAELRSVAPGFLGVARYPLMSGSTAVVDAGLPLPELVLNQAMAQALGIVSTQQPAHLQFAGMLLQASAVVSTPQESSPQAWMSQAYAHGRLVAPGQDNLLLLTIAPGLDMVQVITRTKEWFARTHMRDSYALNSSLEHLLTVMALNLTITNALTAIALVCLSVGGIGVTNVIFMSVRERFQEIGIRMAIGAPRTLVLQQFLLESVLMCSLGGCFGLLLALGMKRGFEWMGVSWSSALSPSILLGSVMCAAVLGMLAGYVPARAASRMNVVDMLTDVS